ncbi:MAG: hypothetical protein PVH52_01525 [bacterium]
MPGLEGVEVIRLESGSIGSIKKYEARESVRKTKVNSSALVRTQGPPDSMEMRLSNPSGRLKVQTSYNCSGK